MEVKLDRSVITVENSEMLWSDNALKHSPTGEIHTLDVYADGFIVGVYDWTPEGATQAAVRRIERSLKEYTAALNALKGE